MSGLSCREKCIVHNFESFFGEDGHLKRHSRNSNPAFTLQVMKLGLIQNFTIIDIGARGGPVSLWKPLETIISYIGFDQDSNECERLNREKYTFKSATFLPYIIGRKKEVRNFFITKFPYSSGLIKGNQKFTARIAPEHEEHLTVLRSTPVETHSLDEVVVKHKINTVDYIKIDTEGSEHEVLEGARKIVQEYNLLGVETEFWLGPIKENLPHGNLNSIFSFFNDSTFQMFDISYRRYARRSLGNGPIYQGHCDNSIQGQILTGDILFLRDPINEMEQGNTNFTWNDETVLKLACLYEISMLNDCALELLDYYKANFPTTLPVDELADILVPPVAVTLNLKRQQYLSLTGYSPQK